MPIYVYQGRNNGGEFVTGKRLALSQDALAMELLKEGVTPISISVESKTESLWQSLKAKWGHKKVSLDRLSMFARQMYTLHSSGVTLTVALRQLAQTMKTPRLSDAIYKMIEDLESGKDFPTAMQQHADVFTPIMISMVRIGQNTGRLDEAFLNLHQFLELEASAIKQIKTVLRYPTIVLVAFIIASIVITFFVIPTFARVFSQANLQLPLMTQILVGGSAFIVSYWYVFVIFFGAIVWSIRSYLKTPKGQYNWDRVQLRIPIFGRLLRRILLLRFAQTFAVVVKSGIPLVEGLGLVAQSIQNRFVQNQIQTMQSDIEHGKSLTQAATTVDLFTPLEIQMLSVSEETGELSAMLEHLANFYQREVEYSLKRLGDIIEPVLIVGVAILVLGLALTVYLPIWNLINIVHN